MDRNLTSIIGSVGELVTIRELIEQGFTVGLYGSSEITDQEMAILPKPVPTAYDYPLGSSCLKVENPHVNRDTKWVKYDELKPFDFSEDEINEVASVCRSLVPCEMARNGTPPCMHSQWLHNPKCWSELYHIIDTYKTQNDYPRQYARNYYAYEHQGICFERLNYVLALRACDKLNIRSRFLRDNLRIHVYVKNIAYSYQYTGLDRGLKLTKSESEEKSNLWSEYYKILQNNLPNSELAISVCYEPNKLDMRWAPTRLVELTTKEKMFKDEKDRIYPYPGKRKEIDLRYDLICEKDGICDVAVEVKTNTGRLAYGQLLRLNLLRHFGHDVYLARVRIDKGDLNSLESVVMPRKFDLEFVDVPEIDLTQHLAEFDDTVNKVFSSDYGELDGFIPKGCLSVNELTKLANAKP